MRQPRTIPGIGPAPCDYMLVGSQPGHEDERTGVPFTGKVGEELDRFLNGDTLPTRDQVWLTNLYSQYRGKDYVYTTADLDAERPRLAAELGHVQPKLIITLGREATRYFLGDVDMDDVHSIPWRCPDRPEITIFPTYHIAAGFRNPEAASLVTYGFGQLAAFLDGRLHERKLYDDPYQVPTYLDVTDPAFFDCYEATDISIDSEGWPSNIWSFQLSAGGGTALVIRTRHRDVVSGFIRYLHRVRPQITYHSALHDLAIGRAGGVSELLHLGFDDTAIMSYLLQVEPRGLKPLCVRHCGMRMQSYDDVMGDASVRLALDYAQALWDLEDTEWLERCQDAFWAEVDKGRRISKLPAVPKTALHKAAQRLLQARRPHKLWEDQLIDIQVAGYQRLGPMPIATLDHVPLDTALHYAARDADGTQRLKAELRPRLQAMGLEDVYQLELSTYPLIERMHYVGLLPDLAHFQGLSERLADELVDLQDRLTATTGVPTFNANSGDQVAACLFDGLGLDGGKKTTSGRFSTNDKILEALQHEHPTVELIGDIRAYRETYKLKHTFVDRLPDFVNRWPFDGRVHATFRTTSVVTGRLAASDPNILAMPKHGKFAKDFRRGWVAGPDRWLGEWDLSQIELRVLAHLSQDPTMLAIFRGERRNPDGSKIDLHAALAERIFGVKPKDQNGSKHRLPAKAINFGLPMGMTNIGLCLELRKNGVLVDEDDAQRWIDDTMALYAGVPLFMDSCVAEAKRNGYIRCLSGRIRYIGGIRSTDRRTRAEAERFSYSTKIQEGAQWLMKQAEARLWATLQDYWRRGVPVEPLVQVHDALTLEFPADLALARDLHMAMIAIMTTIPKGFSVPVETSGDYGLNWATMESF